MPSEYGSKQSVSIYMEKRLVQQAEVLASRSNMKRSALLAEIIKDGLDEWRQES